MNQPTHQQQGAVRSPYRDIWSRPGPWARQRAYIFLCINVVVYAALNVFAYWLHHARYFDFSWQSYEQTRGETLLGFLVFPLSVYEVPIMIVVLGMLTAIIVMVPILVSQLYGFRFSVIFAAVVAGFGHMPVLSLFLVAAAFVASAPASKLPFKFVSALLALAPIIVYFYVATRGSGTWQQQLLDPTPLYAPWVLALLGCALIAAIVLGFARVVQYRPGGVLLSMIPFFVVPVLLFHRYVGSDELEFRLLDHRFGPDSQQVFKPMEDTRRLLWLVGQRTMKKLQPRPLGVTALIQLAREQFLALANELVEADRKAVVNACQNFQQRFPNSKYLPNVLYIKALALDTKFDQKALWQKSQLTYYNQFVRPQSAPVWEQLRQSAPSNAYAAAAYYRLAVLAAREGKVDRAELLLRQLIDRWGRPVVQTQPVESPATLWGLFRRPVQVYRPRIDPQSIVTKGKELLELIDNNRDDPRYGNLPLQKLLALDRQSPDYPARLLQLADEYRDGKLYDNLQVLYALSRENIDERVEMLNGFVRQFSGADAGALACFELARMYQALALARMDRQLNERAVALYRQLIQQYPQSLYAAQAQTGLEKMQTTP